MSTSYKPDLTAPRFRSTTKNILTKELYESFLEKYPEYQITYQEFKAIVKEYNSQLWNTAIDYPDGIELPQGLGYIILVKCNKPKSKNIDFVSSAKYGQIVNYQNWDSDNYLAKICYSNYSLKYRFKDRELWGFTPVRQFKRKVAATFSDNYQNYIHLTKSVKLFNLYKNL